MAQDLVQRAQAGDPQALARLTEQMAPLLQRFAQRLCKHPDVADDTAQEALLAFATKLDDFEGRSALSSWAFTLARTACARQRRGLKNAPALPLEALPEPIDEASPELAAIDQETSRMVNEAIDALPPDYRAVLQLRDLEGLSTDEACRRLGLGPEALKSRLHRARAALAARVLSELGSSRQGEGLLRGPSLAPCRPGQHRLAEISAAHRGWLRLALRGAGAKPPELLG